MNKENIAATGIPIGPLNYYWYKYLDAILPEKTLISILKRFCLIKSSAQLFLHFYLLYVFVY